MTTSLSRAWTATRSSNGAGAVTCTVRLYDGPSATGPYREFNYPPLSPTSETLNLIFTEVVTNSTTSGTLSLTAG
jgi:hypothetical protein